MKENVGLGCSGTWTDTSLLIIKILAVSFKCFDLEKST